MLSGPAIRILVDKLPPEAFDYICEEFPYLLDNLEDWKTTFINFETCSEAELLDNAGYDTLEDMEEHFYIVPFSSGYLVIE